MAAIVEHPAIVKEVSEEFGDLFADEPESRHKLTTIGETCRAVKAETPGKPVERIFDKPMNLHWSAPKVKMVMRMPHA